MNILVIYRHFYPDSPPYASMLRSICGRLAADGHRVTIWCEQPCYKSVDGAADSPAEETLDGIDVRRLPRLPGWRRSSIIRLLDKLAFVPRIGIKALWAKLTGQRYDVVWTATIPPVMQGAMGRFVARLFGARFVYHSQDLYPELAVSAGLWRDKSVWTRLMRWIESDNRKQADPLITLSQDMIDTAAALAGPQSNAIINNFLLDDFGAPQDAPQIRADRVTEGGPMRAVFAGNLGHFQDLDKLVDAMGFVAQPGAVELTLMGEGKALSTLRQQAAGAEHIRFEPHRPFHEAQSIIAGFDVGIVTVQPGIYKVAYPSKTLTYLGLGLPILAVIEAESDLADLVQQNNIGVIVSDRSPQAIATALQALSSSRDTLSEMRENAKALYNQQLSREARLDQWSELVNSWKT